MEPDTVCCNCWQRSQDQRHHWSRSNRTLGPSYKVSRSNIHVLDSQTQRHQAVSLVNFAKTLLKTFYTDVSIVNICMENSDPKITLADIASMLSIIEAVSSRGAVRAEELVAVGELYNRLKTFMEFAKQQIEQTQGEANA